MASVDSPGELVDKALHGGQHEKLCLFTVSIKGLVDKRLGDWSLASVSITSFFVGSNNDLAVSKGKLYVGAKRLTSQSKRLERSNRTAVDYM